MTAILSPTNSSPAISPPPVGIVGQKPRALSPAMSNSNQKRPQSGVQRISSYAMNRMSAYSTASNTSKKGSRPVSMFVQNATIAYPTVRDFAYPIAHPLYHGPPPDTSAATSGRSTPQVGWERPLSDPPSNTWNSARPSWVTNTWGPDEQLAPMAYGGSPKDHGPPYSEDEDLQSPVVVSSRARRGKDGGGFDQDRGYFTGTNGDGSETYYVGSIDDMADGPGGELVTYPPEQARYSSGLLNANAYQRNEAVPRQRNTNLTVEQLTESRYSRDYQFTIASPDEEMHGKAVALFDFARENENELPLVEGQIILVSYRHGQGWLVAQDPKTGESGLVPEEYVRLLRHIEGDWSALDNDDADAEMSDASANGDDDEDTMQIDRKESGHKPKDSVSSEKSKPIVSTFSTSSKDLEPYPHTLDKSEQPPQVVHYAGQVNTPAVSSPGGSRIGDSVSISRSSSRREDGR